MVNQSDILDEAKKLYFRGPFVEFMRNSSGIKEEDLKNLVLEIKDRILSSREVNPGLMLFNVLKQCEETWSAEASMPIHGNWHHILVPGVILAALRNCGYAISDKDIGEGINRGEDGKVSCGFSGTCGAANGVGIVAAIVKKATPLHDQERQEIMRLVADSQGKIALVMRRCCKRSTYIGIECAANYLAQQGLKLDVGKISCTYTSKNKMCAREECPYYTPINK